MLIVATIAAGCAGDGADETAGDDQSVVTLAPTSSTTTAAPTDSSTSTTTSSVPPEVVTGLSEILDAYDVMFDEPQLGYAMLTETESSVVGGATGLQTGVWVSDVGTEITIVIQLAPESSALVQRALAAGGVDDVVADEAETMFSNGFRYRFIEDDAVWFRLGDEAWTRIPLDGQPEVEQLRPLGDPTVYLDSYFASVIDVTAVTAEGDGSTTYTVELEADVFVPVVAPPTSSQNIYDRGWNGVSGAVIVGAVVLDANGELTAVSVDQTPWWEAGWDDIGVLDLMGTTEITWSLQLTRSVEPLETPCTDPVPEPDQAVGEVLVCR